MKTTITSTMKGSKFESCFEGSILEFIDFFKSQGGIVCRERLKSKVLMLNGVQFAIEYCENPKEE